MAPPVRRSAPESRAQNNARAAAAAQRAKAAPLTAADRAMFDKLRIPAALLAAAGVRRVTDAEARALGITGPGDMSGIVLPYCDLHTGEMVTLRVRRDNPPMKDGKPDGKYRCPKGSRHLYFPPDVAEKLTDPNVLIVLVEAEKSALALTAWAVRTDANILPVAMGGCNGWLQNNAPAESTPLPDLDVCNGHRVIVMLDSNVATNPDVRDAQEKLIAELRRPERKCSCVTAATLPQIEGVNGPDDLIAQDDGDALTAKVLDGAAPPDSLGAYSDDALALRFTAEHGNDLRYEAARSHWLAWGGQRWEQDKTLNIFSKVRTVCRAAADECGKKQIAQRVRSAQTVAAIERLARADRRHAATSDQWDADPWLLNTTGGVIDLRTGKMRPARREDYCTKITTAAPGGSCPLWLKFLHEVTAGEKELQTFLQRVCGYILTGVTYEHALFFLYGSGANGKSTFINVLTGILGDYARTAAVETFTASMNAQHPTDLAGLQGARLVTATETAEGRRWDEPKLKQLTGGDKITARFMRQDYFDYTPQFKLAISGNHRPGLRTVDEAMRRRMNLIPFDITIPAAKRDPKLPDKLRAEWGGILQWTIDGCLMWQREGLRAPKVVTSATDDYMASEDSMGRWLEERTAKAANARVGSGEAYQDFRRWAEAAGEYVGSQKRFSQNLEARGYSIFKGRAVNSFAGLRLRGVEDVEGHSVIPVESFRKINSLTPITSGPSTSSTPPKFTRAARAGK